MAAVLAACGFLGAGCAGQASDPTPTAPVAAVSAPTQAISRPSTATISTPKPRPKPKPRPRVSRGVVAVVLDGDSLTLADGREIRLAQIDAPESGGRAKANAECFGPKAGSILRHMLPRGTNVELLTEPTADDKDRYRRLLRYIRANGKIVNLELVRKGAAAPYFYEGVRGEYAAQLETAAENAKRAPRGLWKACPKAVLDPDRALVTGPRQPAP